MCLFVDKEKGKKRRVEFNIQALRNRLHYFFSPVQPTYYSNPPIIIDYYNVQPPYYSNPSYYSGLEST